MSIRPLGRRACSPSIESLERRALLAATIIDDGDAGYRDGAATGASLIAGTSDELNPHAVADFQGNLHAVYASQGRAFYLFKPKGATAWQPAADLGGSGVGEPRVAADPAGGLHLVYASGNEVFYRQRPAGGGAWSNPIQLSTLAAGNSIRPTIAADGLGRVHVVWQDNGPGANDLRYRRLENGAWSAEEGVSPAGENELSPRVAAGADGRISVVWWSDASRSVFHRARSAAGAWGGVTTIDAAASRSIDPDVAIGPDHAVHVVFHDDVSGNWEIGYRRANAAGAFGALQHLASPGTVDALANVAVGADNVVRVSWMDYHSVYLARNAGAGFGAPQIVMAEVGGRFNTVAVDGFNRAFVLAQAQKAGLSNAGSWDLWSYADAPKVVGRHVFYNNSAFDGNNTAANEADNAAIAPDKVALLPGGTATFANYTSYNKGINGIIFDVAGLPAGVAQLSRTNDFFFQVGNDASDPAGWGAAPTPEPITSIRRGGGANGSDRVTIIWPDGAITKQWLRVTVRATANTGLALPDVFYFGNAVGESGNSTGDAIVNGTDFAGARDNQRGSANLAPIDFRWDYNRDRLVNGTDLAIARDNTTSSSSALRRITPSAITPGPGGSSPWATNSGAGFQNDFRSGGPGAGGRWGTYTFTGLVNGTYTLQATWQADPANASNTRMRISTGVEGGREVTVNQQAAPSGTIVGGRHFQSIGTLEAIGGSIRLTVTDRADGRVILDGVRLVSGAVNIASRPDYDLTPDIVAAPNGDLHSVYHAGPDNAWKVYYIHKPVGGAWSNPQYIGGNHAGVPRIGRAPDGTLHVTYHDNDQVWHVMRPAGGGAWTAPAKISGPHKALESDLAVDALGRAHAVWHEDFNAEGRGWEIRYSIRENGAWSAPMSASLSSRDDVWPTIATGPDGSAHVAWQHYQNLRLHYRSRSPNGVWDASDSHLDNESGRSNSPDIAVGADGAVHVAYMEDRQALIPGTDDKRGWEIAYVRRPAGGAWSSPHYFDHYAGGEIDIDPAVGIGTDGSVTVTWSDYNDAYISRRLPNGEWTPMRAVFHDNAGGGRGAKQNVIAVSPLDNSMHVMFMTRSIGLTNNDSWDVYYYSE